MSKLCMNCMKEVDETVGGGEICPHCGWNNNTPEPKGALKCGTMLQDRYFIGRVKCANSEGFTYSSQDTLNNITADVREFCPVTLIYREETTQNVCPAQDMDKIYNSLLDEFTVMSRSLIRTKELSSLISITDIFWENNTAYMVYEHCDSVSLRSYCRTHEMDWNSVKSLFIPMIPSLSSMHALGVKHLGISPDWTVII